MNYKTYAEAKIANPDSEVVTTNKRWSGCDDVVGYFEKRMKEHQLGDEAWVICNPADYCSSIKEFLDAGFKFAIGDLFLGTDGAVHDVGEIYPQTNKCEDSDDKRYILSASALNGGCKIPAKAEQWTAYNNTLPLCELADEQAAMLFNAWRGDGNMQVLNDDEEWSDYNSGFYPLDVYRIKPKSERELFIDAAINHGIKPDAHNAKQIFGELFDSGKFKYIDNTQHFGENI